MRAGDLDRRLRLLRYTAGAANGYGEPGSPSWTSAGLVWASKKDISDGERLSAQGVGATATTRFVVRSSTVTRALKAQDRVVCDGRTYDVVGLKEVGRREGVEITAAAAEPVPA